MTGELDSFSIKNLEVRYGVARSNIYNRINGLKDLGYNLESESREGKSIYNADQVVLMDALDRHIKNGGNIKNFPPPDPTKKEYIGQDNSQLSYRTQDTEQLNQTGQDNSQLSYETQDTPGQSNRSLLTGFLTVDFAEVFAKALATVFPPPLPPAQRGLELAPYRELNEAAVEGYLLSTTNVANLLGIKPSTVTEYGDEFSDAGFVFSRVGRRKGGQIAWRVKKAPLAEESD
jgi:hypothetical protein